jgi:hypothetical protein
MEERKREVVYVYGGSGASGFPLGSREHPWVPLPHERTHSYESLYYNKVMVASKPWEVVYVGGGSRASGFSWGSWENPWVPLPHKNPLICEPLLLC